MTFRRLAGFAYPFRKGLIFCIILMLAETFAILLIPWLGAEFVVGLFSESKTGIGLAALILVCVFGLKTMFHVAQGVLLSTTSERILARLRIEIYDHVQALPLEFFHETRQGDVLALLSYEIEELSDYLTGTLLNVIPLTVTVLGAFALMLRIDPILAIPMAVSVPLFYIVQKILGRRLRPLAAEARAAFAKTVAIEEENLSNLSVIKSFTREESESERHAYQVIKTSKLNTRIARLAAIWGPISQFFAAAAVIIVLWLAGENVVEGNMVVAELVAFLLYAVVLTRPVAELANLWGETQVTLGLLENLDTVMDQQPEHRNGEIVQSPVLGEICFENVGYAYPGRSAMLADCDFHIRAGESVAIVGENGAGKTTIVNLLLRFITPKSGRITLDGVDIQKLELAGLRRSIGMVSQQVHLFEGTVRSNILVGNPSASASDLISAAKISQASEFIEALPNGYETLIGEKGVLLSGGQRQRIALARALVKDPSILILDEPTAMFDPDGERSFVADARNILINKTVILITHRPESLALADRIVRVANGGIRSNQPNQSANEDTKTPPLPYKAQLSK